MDLEPSGNRAFCPGISALFSCETKLGGLIWRSNSSIESVLFENVSQKFTLGIFNLTVINVTTSVGGTVMKVNSTAAVSSIQLSHDGLNLRCIENKNRKIEKEAVIIVLGEYKLICDDNYYNCIIKLLFQHLMCHNQVKWSIYCYYIGPPTAPAVNPITAVDEGSINSTLLISWSQSNCAVQYVITIINSSDDRVYPNITTSNTNTTVTLPTGVEFCVTLVAVDSIGRRGPDTTPVCYHCEWYRIAKILEGVKFAKFGKRWLFAKFWHAKWMWAASAGTPKLYSTFLLICQFKLLFLQFYPLYMVVFNILSEFHKFVLFQFLVRFLLLQLVILLLFLQMAKVYLIKRMINIIAWHSFVLDHSHRHSHAHYKSYSHSLTHDGGRSQCSSSCTYTCCTGTTTGDRCGGGGGGCELLP